MTAPYSRDPVRKEEQVRPFPGGPTCKPIHVAHDQAALAGGYGRHLDSVCLPKVGSVLPTTVRTGRCCWPTALGQW